MYIRVKVTPGAKKEQVVRTAPDTFEVSVKEPAKQNRANRRVQELIARECGVEPSHARLISGHRNLRKIFSVE